MLTRVVILLLILFLPGFSTELVQISPITERDARLAHEILGQAVARIDSCFVALADSAQILQLQRAGLTVAVVASKVDPSDMVLVGPTKQGAEKLQAVETEPGLQRLGRRRYIGSRSDAQIQALLAEGAVWTTRLTERRIPFYALSRPVGRMLAEAETSVYDSLADRVSMDSLFKFNKRLEDFRTRFSYSDSILKARDWLVQQFTGFGYSDISTPQFTFPSSPRPGYNVKCIKRGYAEPEEYIVVGGHYDSYCGNNVMADTIAPGADDDASGVSVTLELARLLRDVPLRKTVLFMPFAGEEQWMVGSSAAAKQFADSGQLIEAMFNCDMVAYNVSNPGRIIMYSYPGTAHRSLAEQACRRLTPVVPVLSTPTPGYDEGPFIEYGAEGMLFIEADFNTPNYHRTTDLCANLDFQFETSIARMLAVAVATAADAGAVTRIAEIRDVGDGHALNLTLANPYAGYSYRLYYGTTSGQYTDSADFAVGQDSITVAGLTEGQKYFFAVFGQPPSGLRSISAKETSETPQVAPRAPRSLQVVSGAAGIHLSWATNTELDVAGYTVYRRLLGGSTYDVLTPMVVGLSSDDSTVAPNVRYEYAVAAADRDGHVGSLSAPVIACRPSFSAGITVVDETTEQYVVPPEDHQHAYYDSLFAPLEPWQVRADEPIMPLGKCDIGFYNSLFYFDDDISQKLLSTNGDSLNWYSQGSGNNLFISGYRTLQNWVPSPIPSDHLMSTQFGVTGYEIAYSDKTVIATGVNGWPSAQLDTLRGLKFMIENPVLIVDSGATVIYTYDSKTDNPSWEGRPCGVAYDTGHGKRVFLAFPLYYLTPTSARAVIAKASEYFGIAGEALLAGDIDGSGLVDLQDMTLLIDYLRGRAGLSTNLARADVNGSCFVNLTDLSWLVSYLVRGWPPPMIGCAQ